MLYSSKHKIQTSDWLNNCSLHCIAETLQGLLNSNLNASFWDTAPYQLLLESFAELYQLKEPTWASVNKISKKLHPGDTEKIWGYALRKSITLALNGNHEYRDELFNTFSMLVNEIVKNNEIDVEQDSSLISSNLNFFLSLREYVQNNPDLDLDNLLSESYLQQYWKNVGYTAYCEHLGSLLEVCDEEQVTGYAFPMITAEELAAICKFLKLNLTVYSYQADDSSEINYETPYSIGVNQPDAIGTVTAVNEGNHWESLAQSETEAAIQSFIKRISVAKAREKNRFDLELFESLQIKIQQGSDLPAQPSPELKSQLLRAAQLNDFEFMMAQMLISVKTAEHCFYEIEQDGLSEKLIKSINNSSAETHERILRINGLKEDLTKTEDMTPLTLAVLFEPAEKVNDLLESGSDLNANLPTSIKQKIFPDMNDALLPPVLNSVWLALELGFITKASILACKTGFLERVKTVDNYGNNIFHHLTLKGDRETLKALNVYGVKEGRLWLSSTAALKARNVHGELLTHLAVKRGDLNLLKELIAEGMSLFDKDQSNNTLAHIAVINDKVEILDYLWGKRFAKILVDPLQRHEQPIFETLNDDLLTPYALALELKRKASIEYMKSKAEDFTHECKFVKAIYDGNLEGAERAIESKSKLTSNLTVHALAELPIQVRKMVMLTCMSSKGRLLPFHLAALSRKKELIPFLNSLKIDLNTTNTLGENALQFIGRYVAIESESRSDQAPQKSGNQFALSLMEHGLNVKSANKRSENVLHTAARSGNSWLLRSALSRGAFIDQVTELGLTPLHYGVYYKNREIVEILIEKGCNQNLFAYQNAPQALFENPHVDAIELSPLCLALEKGYLEFADVLMASSPKNTKTVSGKTALHVAATKGDLDKFKFFLEKYHLNILEKDSKGYTPFHFACKFGHLNIVKYISLECVPKLPSKASFDIDHITKDKSSALMLAQAGEHAHVVNFLKEQGAKLETVPIETGWRAASEKVIQAGESWMKHRAELTQTTTYKLLSIGSIGYHALRAYPLGPHAMIGAGLYHSANYFAPSVPGTLTTVYNRFKTSAHNTLPSYLNNSIKYSAKGGDFIGHYVFKGLNLLDWASDPARRMAGVAGGEIASRLTDMFEIENKEVKAAALFFGQEFSMMAINSYRQYGDMDESTFTYSSDSKYEHAFTIWTSILGRENGELVADFGQSLEDLSDELSFIVGKGVSNKMQNLQQRTPSVWLTNTAQMISNTASETLSYLNISAENKLYVNPTEIMEYVRYKNHQISELRGQLISELETTILHLMPESNYKNYAVSQWAETQAFQAEQTVETLKKEKHHLEVDGEQTGECISQKAEALHNLGKQKGRDEVDYELSRKLRTELEKLLQSQKDKASRIDALSKSISDYEGLSNRYHAQAESALKLTPKYQSGTKFSDQDEQYFNFQKSQAVLIEEEQAVCEELNSTEQRLHLVLNPLPIDPHVITKKAYDLYGEGEDRAGDIADHIGSEFVDAGYFAADQKRPVFLDSVKASLKGRDKFQRQVKKTADTLKSLAGPESRNANAAPLQAKVSSLRARLDTLRRTRLDVESNMNGLEASIKQSKSDYSETLSRYGQERFHEARLSVESIRNDELGLSKIMEDREVYIKMADHAHIVDEAIESGIGHNGPWLKDKIASYIAEQLITYKYSVLEKPDAVTIENERVLLKQKFVNAQSGFNKNNGNFLVTDKAKLEVLFKSERASMMRDVATALIETVKQTLPCIDENESCSKALIEGVVSKIEQIYFPKNQFLKDDKSFIDGKKSALLEAVGAKISISTVVQLLEASNTELKHQNSVVLATGPTISERAQAFLQVSKANKTGEEFRNLVAEATISEILPPEMDAEFRKITKQFVANAIDGRESLQRERLEKAIERITDFFATRPLYDEYKTGQIPDARIRSDLFKIDPIHARAAFLAYACNDKRLEYGLVGMPDYLLFSFYDRFISAQSTTQHSKEKKKMRRVVTDSFEGVGNGWAPSKGELKSIHGYMKDHSAKFSGFEWNSVAPEYYRPVHVYGNDFGRRAASWITDHTGGGEANTNWDLNDSNRRVEVKFQRATSGYVVGKSEPSQLTLDLSHLSRSNGSTTQKAPVSHTSTGDGVYRAKSLEDYAPSLQREDSTTRIPLRETTVPYRLPDTYIFVEPDNRLSEKESAFWRQFLQSSPQFPTLEEAPRPEASSSKQTTRSISARQQAASIAIDVIEKIIPAANANEVQGTIENSKSLAFESDIQQDLEVSLGEKLLIASGRAFVKTGQGVKQLGLAVGEKIGAVEAGTTAIYTDAINKEQKLYDSTPVGQDTLAKALEMTTNIAMAITIPGGASLRGAKLIASAAGTGAIIGGMQATEDGSLSSRAQNAVIGAAEGAIGGYVFSKTAQGLHWAWQEGKVQHGMYTFDKRVDVTHTFSKAKGGQAPKYGHVYDTPENRRIITETFSDRKNFIGTDKWGKDYFAKLLPDGREAWAYLQNGKVKGAGINLEPQYYEMNNELKSAELLKRGLKK